MKRPIEPEGSPEPSRSRRGPGHREPLLVDLFRLVGIDVDIAVPIARPRRRHRHPLVPAVHPAHLVRLHREGEILVHSPVGPPDALRVRVLALVGPDPFDAAEPEAPGGKLLLANLGAGPAVGPLVVEQPPAPQMVGTRDHPGPHPFRHPGLVHEVPDARRHAHEVAGGHADAPGVLRVDPWFRPDVVIPLGGMIFSLSMNCISLAAERFEMEVEAGRSFREARPAALNAALIPHINSLFAVGVVALPGMMTGQILSGVSPLVAAQYQIVVMTMLFGASGISAACYLSLQRGRDTG